MFPPLRLPAGLRRAIPIAGVIFAAGAVAAASAPGALPRIKPSSDGSHFVQADTGRRFVVWGVNYDHDADSRLLEDYWEKEWATVESDFREMRELGANLVRVHLQFARFMRSAEEPDPAALARLGRLVRLADAVGLYLNLTGLGCYHKRDVPAWYDALDERGRWAAQAAFWRAIARTGAGQPAVFCYDLMNEPVLPGPEKPAADWLAGEFGGKHFVQRLTRDLAGRSREQVARAWVERMIDAIRSHDPHTMITVGEIPWNLTFPGAKPFFAGPEVGRRLDFVSVHFYPKKGEIAKALTALSAYELGKPLLIEETFPLSCNLEELAAFIDGSRPIADGWVGFYWGRTPAEYAAAAPTIAGAITREWLEFFRDQAPAMRRIE